MKYNLKGVLIGYKDIDDTNQEIEFENATDALSFICENKNEIDFDNAEIVGTFQENRIIHSASEDDLDYGEEDLSISKLEDLAEDEPYKMRYVSKNDETSILNVINDVAERNISKSQDNKIDTTQKTHRKNSIRR